jgi:hypothetical protein
MACAVASLPVFVIWTSSHEGTAARIASARRTSHDVVPDPNSDQPSSIAAFTAAFTSGWLCPSRCGAKAAW